MSEPIRIVRVPGTWVVRADGAVLAETSAALELTEGRYPPVLYFPRGDVAMAMLDRSGTRTHCPHKGDATYYSIVTGSGTLTDAVWSYETPLPEVAAIAGHLAFYPDRVTIERV
jgi:uncharacterized protein (DUF427 family)